VGYAFFSTSSGHLFFVTLIKHTLIYFRLLVRLEGVVAFVTVCVQSHIFKFFRTPYEPVHLGVLKEVLIQRLEHMPAGKEVAASAFLDGCTEFLDSLTWRFGGSPLCLFGFPSIDKHQIS
jgi:hypothetical protein